MTKKELQQIVIDILSNPEYSYLFGLNANEFAALKPNEIWEQHAEIPGVNPGDPRIGSKNANIPKADLDIIKDIYLSIKDGDDERDIRRQVNNQLELVTRRLSPDKYDSYSSDVEKVITIINNDPTLSDIEKEQAINDYIAGIGGTLRTVPIYDPSQIGVVKRDMDTGQIQTKPFGGHFGDMAGVYELIFQNTDTVTEFQEWLEANGLVQQGAFDDSKGVPNGLLRSQLAQYMAWIDTNKYVDPGTQDYVNVMNYDLNADPNNPFTNSAFLVGENLKHQKMFAYFLSDYKDNHDNRASTMDRANTAARFKKYMENVPGELAMEQLVEGAFYNSMNRLPTKDELKEQVRLLATSYIDEFNQMNEMYAFIDNMNMIKAPNQSWQVEPTDEVLNQFVDTAAQTASENFNETYRDDISAATYASEKMKMDEAMLKAMFG